MLQRAEGDQQHGGRPASSGRDHCRCTTCAGPPAAGVSRRRARGWTRYFNSRLHHQLREDVRHFAEREVRPRIAEMETARTVQHELSRLIARQGWIGATVDPRVRRHGGRAPRQDHHHRGTVAGQRRDGRHGAGLAARRRQDRALRQRGTEEDLAAGGLPRATACRRSRSPSPSRAVMSWAWRRARSATATTTYSMAAKCSWATATSAIFTGWSLRTGPGSQGPVRIPGRVRPARLLAGRAPPSDGPARLQLRRAVLRQLPGSGGQSARRGGRRARRRVLLQRAVRAGQPHRRLPGHPPGDPGGDHQVLPERDPLRQAAVRTRPTSKSSWGSCSPG